jgi:glycosyltransferase involved in cell wall biosynthesis
MRVMSWLIDRYATAGLGNARTSLQSLYGIDWQTDPRWRLMYLGIDLVPFEQSVDRMDVCQQYGLPATASIIGHVGRLTPAKNHRFIIDIAAEIERQCDNIWFVLAGDGPLYSEILDYARQKHVTHLVMTGGVAETRSLYGIMDLFLFPSLWEGLPQAVVEAQAAGLRCLCANTITPEVSVVSEAVRFMDLAEGPTKWAAACQELLSLQKLDPDQARIAVSVSPFSIEYSASQLTQLYVSMQSLTMNAGT